MPLVTKTDIEIKKIPLEKLKQLLLNKIRISSVDVSNDKIITIEDHNFLNNDEVEILSSGNVIGGLNFNTKYFCRNVTAKTLQFSLTSGGSVIDLTNAGSGILEIIGANYDIIIDGFATQVDGIVYGKIGRRYLTPLVSPYPDLIKACAADLLEYFCYNYRPEMQEKMPEVIKLKYNNAVDLLNEIRDSKIDIPELEIKESSDAFKYSSTINNIMNTL